MKQLHTRYKDDPDAIFLPDGIKFIGPKGKEETEEEHNQRLAHNCRMRFNRSFSGWVVEYIHHGLIAFVNIYVYKFGLYLSFYAAGPALH